MFKRALYFPLLIIILAELNACSDKKQNEPDDKPVAVTLSAVSAGDQSAVLASGEVEAVQTADISTRVMGRITNIFVKVGDRVNKGQLLANVWDEDIKAKRAQAEAMIMEAEAASANAEKDYDRFSNLYKLQSATAKELDNVTLQYNSAKARLAGLRQMRNELNANLSYNNIIAPFSGVIIRKLAETGSIASPGMPILTIEQNGDFQVSASVAESDISNIHLGDAANIQIRSVGKFFNGKIIQINPSSQFTGGQFIIKISISETEKKDMYAGMFVSISIPLKDDRHINDKVVLIPYSSVISRDELKGIYTVSTNNRALLRWIRLGKAYGNKVEVLSGLSKDEKFIYSSQSKLYNGARVVVKETLEGSLADANK